MVMMYHFVFWFSTRFGSLVVAILTLIQSMAVLIACCIGMEHQDAISNQIEVWLKDNEMRFMKDTLEDMKRDPENYLVGFITYLSLHCFSCLLLIFGALKVMVWLVYPFLVLEFVRLIFITVNFVIAMLLVKENILNLGFLISCCCGGGFILLFLFYLWFCVLSFVQIVKELEFVYKMGHYYGSKLNLDEYQRMNVPELGAEYFSRDDGLVPIVGYNNNYNKKYINDKMSGNRFNTENDYNNALARPVY